jgi:nucleotide-binding universal stress UspA family protein
MERIVVPIDFSFSAKEALQYAAQLAKNWHAYIDLVHVHSGSVSTDQPVSFGPNKGHKDLILDWMKDFVEEAQLPEEVKVNFLVLHGVTERKLIDLSGEGVDLMIMGATGKSNLTRRLFGSVSEAVARRADCPVLLIPKGTEFAPIQHLLLGSDFGAVQQDQLTVLFQLADRFKADLHFVHVEKGETNHYPEIEQRLLKFLLRPTTQRVPYQLACIKAPTVYEGINQYLNQHPCDWVVMAAGKYSSVWDQLFHRSQTKAMILHARKPLMVFHLGD